ATQIRNLSDHVRFQQIPGQVGQPFRVATESALSHAKINLPYAMADVPNGDISHVDIFRYDEARMAYDALGQDGHDANRVWVETTDLGIFVLIHRPTWEAAWERTLQTAATRLRTATVTTDTTGNTLYALIECGAPSVDGASAPTVSATTDSDGDGLYDVVECYGIFDEDGIHYETDPKAWDTDGDGLSDAEEVGGITTSNARNHHELLTDPLQQDSDNDDLLDADEAAIGTDPRHADSDGDTLSDRLELELDFDPLDPNPDGDHLRDDQEYAEGTDPYYANPRLLAAIRITVQGAILGDLGETLAERGWLEEDTYLSIYYIAGWVTSGFVAAGDVRDTIGSAVRLDFWDTLLNAAAIVPAVGDGTKVARIVTKVTQYAVAKGKRLAPFVAWFVKNFDNAPFLTQIYTAFGYSDAVIAKYCLSPT
ncbi:MAG: hypothetical protein MI865_11945, partial [Proteobacteria bacterium]|nr:hypothetical protein [Pseudomonadota bacterium]